MPRTHKTVKDKLDEALGAANVQLEKSEKPQVEVLPAATKALEKVSRPEDYTPQCEEDYEYARATYYQLLEKSQEAINGILEVAQETESPRGYEVVGILVKAASDVATALMSLQEKMKNLRGLKATESAATSEKEGDTYIFAGLTDDILKAIEEGKIKK